MKKAKVAHQVTYTPDESRERLSQDPQTRWVQTMEVTGETNWQGMTVTHHKWSQKSKGLTPMGTALISIAVGVATGGTGDIFMAMGSAALSTVSLQTTNSLINHNGNIGSTLRDLGSTQSIKSILISVGQAAATYGTLEGLGISKTSQAFPDRLARSAIQTGVTTGYRVTQGDLNLGEALLQMGASTAASAGGGYLANIIGDNRESMIWIEHKALHALLGFAEGALSDLRHPLRAATGGALGAFAAESLAELLPQSIDLETRLVLGQIGAVLLPAVANQDPLAGLQTGTIALEFNHGIHSSSNPVVANQELMEEQKGAVTTWNGLTFEFPVMEDVKNLAHTAVEYENQLYLRNPLSRIIHGHQTYYEIRGRIQHTAVDLLFPTTPLDFSLLFVGGVGKAPQAARVGTSLAKQAWKLRALNVEGINVFKVSQIGRAAEAPMGGL
ncbi:MAG: DUF637 domain-containing protein, partial [Bdellovibrionales bacterium]|nr:DUF637 domain-containing protein [Bdellovibrionales bacterium]